MTYRMIANRWAVLDGGAPARTTMPSSRRRLARPEHCPIARALFDRARDVVLDEMRADEPAGPSRDRSRGRELRERQSPASRQKWASRRPRHQSTAFSGASRLGTGRSAARDASPPREGRIASGAVELAGAPALLLIGLTAYMLSARAQRRAIACPIRS